VRNVTKIRCKILEVDLTDEKTRIVDVTVDVEKYLGGRGLASKLCWDLIPQGADPLGPDNILHVGMGPMTGLVGNKTVFCFKSPLTGWKGRSTMSGYFAREMMYAGYNTGILITGRAERPVYLYVWDDDVQIRDASHLWGAWKQKTEYTLRTALKEETGECFGVANIGPAGEHLVRYANISTEWIHSVSKWGCGAVMGSKNLKAIAVRGTKGPEYADHHKVWELFEHYLKHPATVAHKYRERRFGHTTSMPTLYHAGWEGIKNNQLGWHDVCLKSNYVEHEMKYHVWTDGCPGCATACFVPYFVPDGNRGPVVGEFRHDNTGCFNANILVGYEDMTYIEPLVEELGMDGEEVGGIVAWAMELYERGILSKEDLDGIDLKWGDVDATCSLLKKIAYRKGIGDVLADGYRFAIPRIGQECEQYAWQVHGCSCATYDLRGLPDQALSYASSHTGARMGTGFGTQITESATICHFTASPAQAIWGSREECARQYLNAVCGWDLTLEDIKTIAMRNFMLERCFSLREGYRPSKDDKIPDRAFDLPITNKYGQTFVLDRDWFTNVLKDYYVTTLQLTDEGRPSIDLIRTLKLDFVIPALESVLL
jgi:aldehyde:ferredoxin oxidoreductase